MEVRFIKNKNQALDEFKSFKALIENRHDKKIKALQSDNGGEFINKEFDEYLKSQGIQRRLTTPYTPEQNGVAERKNRTLIESARCLLIQSGLSPSFWAEAVSTANYIRNRCPTKKLDGKTPYEAWHGRTPTVTYFKEFGCKVHCLDRTPTKGKLDTRSREGIFIGYPEESKGFRVWLPDAWRVETTREVRFLEGQNERKTNSFKDFYTPDAHNRVDRMRDSSIDIQLSSASPNEGEVLEEIGEESEVEESTSAPAPGRRRG